MERSVVSAVIIWIGCWTAAIGAETFSRSAMRLPGVSYQIYMQQARVQVWPRPGETQSLPTPMDQARPWRESHSHWPKLTQWSALELQPNFERARDERFLRRPEGLRRSSWLYPDDGCFARAQLMNMNFLNWQKAPPNKIYAFGDLTAQTLNTSTGSVTWWYHVASLVEVDGEAFVLDPAIEAHRPLTVAEWLGRMSTSPDEIQVAICASGAYSPYDPCNQRVGKNESLAHKDQVGFLDSEWERLVELGRDPEAELGDRPPWSGRVE